MHKFTLSHWWALLFILFFPFLVMSLYSDFIRESELNSRLGWLVMLGGFAYLARHHVYPYRFLLLILIFITLSGAMDLLYAVTFGGVFTSASFEAISQSDPREIYEFLTVYASYENLMLLLLYLTISYLLLKRMLVKTSLMRKEKVLVGLAIVMFIVAIVEVQKRNRVFDTIPGFNGVAIDYINNREGFEQRIQAREELDTQTDFSASSRDIPQTYVIIIGESMNRNHMSLYGYPRATTPMLDAVRSDLITFENIVTPYAQTAASLRHVLTEANTDNQKDINQSVSLMGVFNKAGFETWWLSNQQPMRMPFAALAKTADHSHFISHDFHGVEVERYDGYLLPYIQEAIQAPAEKKVIFVHLMGSHLDYNNRYPPEKSVFQNRDNLQPYSSDVSDSQVSYINSYDNSIHYTDEIVGTTIADLTTVSNAAALLFFADHGEEVFDTKDFKGHGPDGVTASMLEVPFIVWRNSAYRETFPDVDQIMANHTGQPGLLDDVFHFAQCLTQVESSLYDAQNALCSADFQPRKRIAYGQDYDTELKRKAP
jgi:heptose-I-phosphate ethanolaminephosphotransferase